MIDSKVHFLEAKNITKVFGSIKALDSVTFGVLPGEILALCGENGAGKSTLMKILSGVYPYGTFAGEILINGKSTTFSGTKDAEKQGISIIHQELNLFPALSVGENLFAGDLPRKGSTWMRRLGLVDWEKVRSRAQPVLDSLQARFPLSTPLGELSVGDQQLVEIAKSLLKKSKLLILDEPTSALSNREVDRLFEILGSLRRQGTACIYISHKMDEVFALADRVAVLRDGKSVGGGRLKKSQESAGELTSQDVVKLMVGRDLSQFYPPKKIPSASMAGPRSWDFVVRNLSARNKETNRAVVHNVGFRARQGEILGIAGMMGSGRSEIFYSLMGHPAFEHTGEVELEGKVLPIRSVSEAVSQRLGLVTEDRKRSGLHLGLTIRENISLASLDKLSRFGIVQRDVESERTHRYMRRLRIKAASSESIVGTLSGGNQQKVALAKWAAIHPKVLLLDEPTRGVDIGAKFEIYSLLNELVAEGMRIVVISSELPEIIGICNRVVVMSEGKIAGELEGDAIQPESIMQLAAQTTTISTTGSSTTMGRHS